MTNQPQLLWQNPDWQKKAHDWIRAEASRHSIQITGEIEQPHIRHWSTVMKIPSSEGSLYFKATAGETVYEIALTEKLAEWSPENLPDLIAVDTKRGWMLMRDGGEMLRASIRPTKDVSPWTPIIPRYAELQIELAEHVDEILALGIPDRRLAALPLLLKQLLLDGPSLMIGQEKGLTPGEFQKLQDLVPRFEQICSELSAVGIPESLNHGDFHDGNVLIKDGRITFFDWGDASVTHPFISLRTFFVSIENSLELDDYAFTPEMAALLDLYLEPFQEFASKNDLLRAYELSKPVASVISALAWHQGITRMDDSIRAEYAWIVPEVLREFIENDKRISE
ncbi:MAG: phosphotransferase [Anaerolineales bacterium]|nr:phosphotransferase [Anaerolineales bacterium]